MLLVLVLVLPPRVLVLHMLVLVVLVLLVLLVLMTADAASRSPDERRRAGRTWSVGHSLVERRLRPGEAHRPPAGRTHRY